MTNTGAADGGDNCDRFAAVCDGFARARTATGCAELALRFADQRIDVRVVGGALARRIHEPFAHLRADAVGSAPRLILELWDVHDTGVPSPLSPDNHVDGDIWDLGDSTFAASADGRFVSHEVRGSVVWLDRWTERVAGWFADGRDLSLHQRSKPLQTLLAVWASDRDLQAVHAGLVARRGHGVLLPGRSGAGKSTAALTCLRDGYAYAGDDWIALVGSCDGGFIGHGLYGTASLEPEHAERFADLQPEPIREGAPAEKCLLALSRVASERLATAVPIRALALPRVVDRADCRVRPASPRDALLTMVPSSIFTMSPRGGRRGAERLFELAAAVPAYWLEIGRDLRQIPRRVDDILREVDRS